MPNAFYIHPLIQNSVTGKYTIQTHATIESNGVTYHSAIILKKIRSYWEPVAHGINITDWEIEGYLNEYF